MQAQYCDGWQGLKVQLSAPLTPNSCPFQDAPLKLLKADMGASAELDPRASSSMCPISGFMPCSRSFCRTGS